MKYKVYNKILNEYNDRIFIAQNGKLYITSDSVPEYSELCYEHIFNWNDELLELYRDVYTEKDFERDITIFIRIEME